MAKQVVEHESYKSGDPSRVVRIFTTDDGVRYVFEHLLDENEIWFSHRFYPNRPRGEQRDPSNYRLPEAVEEAANSKVPLTEFEYLDGMIDEAELNQSRGAKFNNAKSTQSA